FLLGELLRLPASGALDVAADERDDLELLAVLGPDLARDLVGRRLGPETLRQLLEERLPVERVARADDAFHRRREAVEAEAPRRLEPAVEVDRARDRLEDVGQDRRRDAVFLDAAADLDHGVEPETLRFVSERLRRDDDRLDASQLAFVALREGPEEEVGDHE